MTKFVFLIIIVLLCTVYSKYVITHQFYSFYIAHNLQIFLYSFFPVFQGLRCKCAALCLLVVGLTVVCVLCEWRGMPHGLRGRVGVVWSWPLVQPMHALIAAAEQPLEGNIKI